MKDPSKIRLNKVSREVWDNPKKGKELEVSKQKYDDRAWWEMKRKEGLRLFKDQDGDGVITLFDKYPRDKRRQ